MLRILDLNFSLKSMLLSITMSVEMLERLIVAYMPLNLPYLWV